MKSSNHIEAIVLMCVLKSASNRVSADTGGTNCITRLGKPHRDLTSHQPTERPTPADSPSHAPPSSESFDPVRRLSFVAKGRSGTAPTPSPKNCDALTGRDALTGKRTCSKKDRRKVEKACSDEGWCVDLRKEVRLKNGARLHELGAEDGGQTFGI